MKYFTLVYKLTVETVKRVEESGLSRRELARRLRTSVPQLYRLLDPTYTKKSIDQLVSLLQVVDCTVAFQVTKRSRTHAMGRSRVELDKALALAAALEDEETLAKLARRK